MDSKVSGSEEAIYSNVKELNTCIDDLSGEVKNRITYAIYACAILLIMMIIRAFGISAEPLCAASVIMLVTISTDIRLKKLVSRIDQYRTLIGDSGSSYDSQSLTAVWHYTTNAKKYVLISLWSFVMCGIDIVGIAAIGAAILIH